MVPKVAPGGPSFINAGKYYLGEGYKPLGGIAGYMLGEGHAQRHQEGDDIDVATGEKTRVGFTVTRNLPTEDPCAAFELMQARYAAYLKECASKPGRRLKEAVYAYSLSWSPEECPSIEDMLYAAETSLMLLGMEANQAVIVQHVEKAYPHIHVIANRVHPSETRAVHTSMDRLKLSRWAEAYEREQGRIWCEQRVENNAHRDRGEIVKDVISKTRHEIESERSGAAPEIAAWRSEQDQLRRQEHEAEHEMVRMRQQNERRELEARTQARIDSARAEIKSRYQSGWRQLYKAEREHKLHVRKHRHSIFERAIHAIVHSGELGHGKPLSAAEIAIFALSQRALLDRIAHVYRRQRLALSSQQVAELKAAAKTHWSDHHKTLAPMRMRHTAERKNLSRQAKRDWQQLGNVRKAGLDRPLFEASQHEKEQLAKVDRGATIAASASRAAVSPLCWVWLAFRAKIANRRAFEKTMLQNGDTPAAVSSQSAKPNRAWLRTSDATSSEPIKEQPRGSDQEIERD